jgi:hypothetical protein
MRRPLFISLLVTALGVWGWALWRTGWLQTKHVQVDQAKSFPSHSGSDLSLGRDPFRGPWVPPEDTSKRVAPKKIAIHKSLPALDIPPIPLPTIKGFLGGDPPMAILGLNLATELVHPGSLAFGWTVKAVTPGGVDLEHDGQRRHLDP